MLAVTVNEAQNREISQLRLMTLQNRWTLNLLTAASGGTCVLLKLNITCRTHISDDMNSKNATDAMHHLRVLQKAIDGDFHSENGWLRQKQWL